MARIFVHARRSLFGLTPLVVVVLAAGCGGSGELNASDELTVSLGAKFAQAQLAGVLQTEVRPLQCGARGKLRQDRATTCQVALGSGERIRVNLRVAENGDPTYALGTVPMRLVEQRVARKTQPGARVSCPKTVTARVYGRFRCVVHYPDGAKAIVSGVQLDQFGGLRTWFKKGYRATSEADPGSVADPTGQTG